MRKTLLAPAALALVLATGCTIDLGGLGATVEQAEVEKQISQQLTPKLGGAPRSVACPGDLKGEVGTKLQCKLVTAAGQPQDVTVTVTSVEGSTVNFDINSTPTAAPPSSAPPSTSADVPVVERDALEPRIIELLTPQLGARPNYVSCPENLRGQVGTTLQCQLVDAGGLERQVVVTVTSVVGTTVNFNLRLLS